MHAQEVDHDPHRITAGLPDVRDDHNGACAASYTRCDCRV